jgi:ubiquinone biosynthesis protein UbiJ
MSINKVRGLLYRLARVFGDVNAVAKGHVAKRIARRIAGKFTGRLLGRIK